MGPLGPHFYWQENSHAQIDFCNPGLDAASGGTSL